jgi:hypothetical protein
MNNMMMYLKEQKEFTTEYARLYGLAEKQIDKLASKYNLTKGTRTNQNGVAVETFYRF